MTKALQGTQGTVPMFLARDSSSEPKTEFQKSVEEAQRGPRIPILG